MRVVLSLLITLPLLAEEPKPAASKITAVTVYQTTALVTRDVTAPEAAGLAEVIVTPMPPATLQSSLYAESSDGIRVLSVRFRTRNIQQDTREDVRKLEATMKDLKKKATMMAAMSKANEANLAFVGKLEAFTAATLGTLTEKGLLDSDKTIALATFIQKSRVTQTNEETQLKLEIENNKAEIDFTAKLIQERSGGIVTRVERDALINIEKAKAGAGVIKLNYLVSDASWKPQYKLRASGTGGNDKVSLEYQAAVTQHTGEDWPVAVIELSTAQPCQNAAPPDLRVLEVSIGSGGMVAGKPGVAAGYAKDLEKKSQMLRGEGARNNVEQKAAEAGKNFNDAAALEQYRDLLLSKEELERPDLIMDINADGPAVTYALKTKMNLASRGDEHIVEIGRYELAPKFTYKAVPVLTPHVYRLAELTNSTEVVLLPGEATMYLGKDFVGQAKMPLVAAGKAFSAGFGVDPQLQVSRKLMDKTRTVQGGNQVINFKYRILLSSYKTTPVDVQVWDRIPHTESQAAIAITIISEKPKLSEDALYVRDEKPKNLLRWDVKVEPKMNGDKSLPIDYEYRLELDKSVNIGGFMSK